MADIKTFPTKEEPKPPRVWVCNCGCSTFELLESGETKCALCYTISDHEGGWYRYPSDQEWAKDSPMRDIRGNDDVAFVKAVMKSRIDDESAALVVVLEKSGRLHTWSAAETKEHADWAIEELQRVGDLVKALSKDLP